MDNTALLAALNRIGWSDDAAHAFTRKGFNWMDELGFVASDMLKETCKKIRAGRPGIPEAEGHTAVPAIYPVDIPTWQEQKLMGMHLWVTVKSRLQRGFDANEFTLDIGADL